MLQWVFIKDSKNTHLSSAKKIITAHFLSVYVTSSQDKHLSNLESITFVMLFSFLTAHIKSTKSSEKSVMHVGFLKVFATGSYTPLYYLESPGGVCLEG